MWINKKTQKRLDDFNRGLGFAIGANYNDGTMVYPVMAFATAFAEAVEAVKEDGLEDITLVDFAKTMWPTMKRAYL